MAEKKDAGSDGLMRSHDGSLSLFVPGSSRNSDNHRNTLSAHQTQQNYQSTYAGAYSNQQIGHAPPGMTQHPPHLGQHLAHQGYYPSSVTTTYVSAHPTGGQSPSLVVACPSCRQHLMPPPGAPLFACPCGQRMAVPSAQHTTQYGSNTGHFPQYPHSSVPYNPYGASPSPRNAGPSAAPSVNTLDPFEVVKPGRGSGGSGVGGVAALSAAGSCDMPVTHEYAGSQAQAGPGQGGVRHVRCPRCHSLLATSTDITVCGVCGTHMGSGQVHMGSGQGPGQGHTHGAVTGAWGGAGGVPYTSVTAVPSKPRTGWEVFWKGL